MRWPGSVNQDRELKPRGNRRSIDRYSVSDIGSCAPWRKGQSPMRLSQRHNDGRTYPSGPAGNPDLDRPTSGRDSGRHRPYLCLIPGFFLAKHPRRRHQSLQRAGRGKGIGNGNGPARAAAKTCSNEKGPRASGAPSRISPERGRMITSCRPCRPCRPCHRRRRHCPSAPACRRSWLRW